MWYFYFHFHKIIRFPDFLRIFYKSPYLNNTSSRDLWCTSQIWYNYFLFRKIIRFLDFFRISPNLHILTIFLHRTNSILLKYVMIILFHRKLSSFQTFPDFFVFSSDFRFFVSVIRQLISSISPDNIKKFFDTGLQFVRESEFRSDRRV